MNIPAFFASVRSSLYGGGLNVAQVTHTEAIINAFATYGDGDDNKLAYCLATAHHETGQFKWLKEIWGPTAAQKKYEGRADLGNTVAGDGKRFMGRGDVMITGRRNYTDWSKRLGIDLVSDPDRVTEADIAARILVQGSMLGTFTGKKLGDYIAGDKVDFVNARRVINGTDKAALIAGYATKFAAAIRDAGEAEPASEPVSVPDDASNGPSTATEPATAAEREPASISQAEWATLLQGVADLKQRVAALEGA